MLKKDQNYEATRLHFENLVNRYGNPIVISNLIKVRFLSVEFIIFYLWFCNMKYFFLRHNLDVMHYMTFFYDIYRHDPF